MVINEIRCKSILNKSGIPGIDYALNPYVGCQHKCQYCYAVFMKRFTKHREPWGDFVDAKINASEVLRHQLKKIKQKSNISFGTVCDAYQPIEAKYELTRKCLEVLTYYKHSVSILTKSCLVFRDIEILKKLKDIEVGFTITTAHDDIRKVFEPNASSVENRFNALEILSQNGISTWVFVAPLLPYFSDSDTALAQIFESSQNAGAGQITFDSLNPYPVVWNKIINLIRKFFPAVLDRYNYYYQNKTSYEKQIKSRIDKVGRKFKIKFDFAF